MRPEHLITVLTLQALVWSTGALWAIFRGPGFSRWFLVGNAFAGVAAVALATTLSSQVVPGRNAVFLLASNLSSGNLYHLCAGAVGATLGVAAALWPWQVRWSDEPPQPRSGRMIRAVRLLLLLPRSFFSVCSQFLKN